MHHNTRSTGNPALPLLELAEVERLARERRRALREGRMAATEEELARIVAEAERRVREQILAEQERNPRNNNGPEPVVPPVLFGARFGPGVAQVHDGLERDAEEYTIPAQFINLIQNGSIFRGFESEDPHAHIRTFLALCNTFKPRNMSQDNARKLLFRFSLQDKALSWFDTVAPESMPTFDDMARKFITKYFPPARVDKLKSEIRIFRQYEGEGFGGAWERFLDLLRKCPNHGLPMHEQLEIFYKSLTPITMNMVNACAGGSIMDRSGEGVQDLFRRLAGNETIYAPDRQYNPRAPPTSTSTTAPGMMNVDSYTAVQAQLDNIVRMMSKQNKAPQVLSCGLCDGDHHIDQCTLTKETVQALNDYGRQQGYNPGWRNPNQGNWGANQGNFNAGGQRPFMQGGGSSSYNPNPSWRPNYPPGFSDPKQEPKKDSVELMIEKLERTMVGRFDVMDKRYELNESRMNNLESTMGTTFQ